MLYEVVGSKVLIYIMLPAAVLRKAREYKGFVQIIIIWTISTEVSTECNTIDILLH